MSTTTERPTTQTTTRPRYTPSANHPPIDQLRDQWRSGPQSLKASTIKGNRAKNELELVQEQLNITAREHGITPLGPKRDQLAQRLKDLQSSAARLEADVPSYDQAARRTAVLEILSHATRIKTEFRSCCDEMNCLAGYERRSALSSTEADRLRWLRDQYWSFEKYIRELPALREEIVTLLPKGYSVRLEMLQRGSIGLRDAMNVYGGNFKDSMLRAAGPLDDLISRMSDAITNATWAELEQLAAEPITLMQTEEQSARKSAKASK